MSINNPILVLSALIWEQWTFICRLSECDDESKLQQNERKGIFFFRVIEATAQPQTQAWRLTTKCH